MARKLFGVGARGELVGDVQRALMAARIPLPKADEIYGRDTQTAVSAFQGTQGLPRTGDVDLETWRLLRKVDMPGIDQRALQLTAAFEGHDYTLAVGNFDGAWLTWGIVGALVMRAIFIVVGVGLIHSFHWIIYLFGAFLIYTGIKLMFSREGGDDPGKGLRRWWEDWRNLGRAPSPRSAIFRKCARSSGGAPPRTISFRRNRRRRDLS